MTEIVIPFIPLSRSVLCSPFGWAVVLTMSPRLPGSLASSWIGQLEDVRRAEVGRREISGIMTPHSPCISAEAAVGVSYQGTTLPGAHSSRARFSPLVSSACFLPEHPLVGSFTLPTSLQLSPSIRCVLCNYMSCLYVALTHIKHH